jgi:hypothetical protein
MVNDLYHQRLLSDAICSIVHLVPTPVNTLLLSSSIEALYPKQYKSDNTAECVSYLETALRITFCACI